MPALRVIPWSVGPSAASWSLQIPNLTHGEVTELFGQYQAESGQLVEPSVVDAVFEATRGRGAQTCT